MLFRSHDAPGPVAGLANLLLSLRFWTFALASFGMTGILLNLAALHAVVALGVAGLTGVAVGAGVTLGLRAVSRETVSTSLDARTLRGQEARVVLPIGPGKTGKVRLTHGGQLLDLPATTSDSRRIEPGESVLVVDVRAGTAEVTSSARQIGRAHV